MVSITIPFHQLKDDLYLPALANLILFYVVWRWWRWPSASDNRRPSCWCSAACQIIWVEGNTFSCLLWLSIRLQAVGLQITCLIHLTKTNVHLQVLKLHIEDPSLNTEVTKLSQELAPPPCSSGISLVHVGLMAGVVALSGAAVIVYLKRSQLWSPKPEDGLLFWGVGLVASETSIAIS